MLEARWSWSPNIFTSSTKFLQPRLQTRDTKTTIETLENKGKSKISPSFIKTLLAREIFKFAEQVNEYRLLEYTYEVDFVLLKNLRGTNSLCNDIAYQEFYDSEIARFQNKTYDEDIHIRDLYPLEIHTSNKREIDISRFNLLNDFILGSSDNITRRVTKKEIVYKKNKSKNIVTISIKKDYINLYTLSDIERFDINEKLLDVAETSRKPMNKRLIINSEEDMDYVQKILKSYFVELQL